MPDTSVHPHHLTKTREILEINHGRCTQGVFKCHWRGSGGKSCERCLAATLLLLSVVADPIILVAEWFYFPW